MAEHFFFVQHYPKNAKGYSSPLQAIRAWWQQDVGHTAFTETPAPANLACIRRNMVQERALQIHLTTW